MKKDLKLNKDLSIQILGAGPAGLTTGFYANKNKIPIKIYESTSEVGGNCKTIIHGEFKFDTGAHRLHDKYNDVTSLIKKLLNKEIIKVEAPSQIYYNGSMINFPLDIASTLREINFLQLSTIIKEVLFNTLKLVHASENFKDLAYSSYGKTLSELFLINYTEKLWGEKAENLSVNISGGRLRNHNLTSLLKGLFQRKNNEVNHLDGVFYYPVNGFGEIFNSLRDNIGLEKFSFNSPINTLEHDKSRVLNLGFGNNNFTKADLLISTLPLTTLVKSLDPIAPDQILEIVSKLNFRDLKLCVLYLDKPFFTKNASMYYPDIKFPFTRIYEPKNRSVKLAPEKKTCIVVEVPCSKGDMISRLEDSDLFNMISSSLIQNKLINEVDIFDHTIINMPKAYPIISTDIESQLEPVFKYLKTFKNLYLAGRNAEFKYTHTHNIFKNANLLIEQIIKTVN